MKVGSNARGMILVVDDEASVRDALVETLEDEGYEVAAARDGAEALAWLRANPPPCLILLDLWMPRMTGEAFRAAQLADPAIASIPVVVISAVKDGAARARAMQTQAYLQKPVSLDGLLTMVERYC